MPNLGQNRPFFVLCDLEIWRMTLKNNRAPLICHFKLCASFHSHWWSQTGVTVQKRSNWGKICFDLCDLDLWPLTFCMDITFSMVIILENFMMKRWEEQCEKRCHRRTDRRTDSSVLRAAWSQLKISKIHSSHQCWTTVSSWDGIDCQRRRRWVVFCQRTASSPQTGPMRGLPSGRSPGPPSRYPSTYWK